MPVYKQAGSPNWLVEFVIDGQRFRRSSGTAIKRAAEALQRDAVARRVQTTAENDNRGRPMIQGRRIF